MTGSNDPAYTAKAALLQLYRIVKAYRLKAGLGVKDIAARAGMTYKELTDILYMTGGVIDMERFIQLAMVCGKEVEINIKDREDENGGQ